MPTIWTGLHDLLPIGGSPLLGDVTEFNEARGLGIVEYGPGRQLAFHCTAITDGSRRIEVGTVVAFVIVAGRLGRLEARSIRPLPGVVHPGSTLVVDDVRVGGIESSESGIRWEEPFGLGEEQSTLGAVNIPVGAVQLSVGSDSVEPDFSASVPVEPEPFEPWPFAPDPAAAEPAVVPEPVVAEPVVPEPEPDSGDAAGSVSSEPPDSVEATPPLGTPAVESPPVDGPAPLSVEESPGDTPGTEPRGPSKGDDSPRPDFWSPFARSSTGPPPTWRTPVTPASPPSSERD